MNNKYFSALILALIVSAAQAQNNNSNNSYEYGISANGKLKYTHDFKNFDYLNPQAPKNGSIVLSLGIGGLFDKFNPYSLKGDSAPAIDVLMFDTLCAPSLDETASVYGLIADGIKIFPAKNPNKIIFHINPLARFNNNDKIHASDVKFSFETLIKYGAPNFKFLYADIDMNNINTKISVDDSVIEFNLKPNKINNEMPLLLAGLPVFSSKWLANKGFEQLTFEQPISSGAYLIEDYKAGRNINYKLNPKYWAKNHPTRKGWFNFNTIRFEVYQDDVAKLEAFKAGAFDANIEYRAKNWASNYKGSLFDNGSLIKTNFKHSNGNGMQGFAFNLRKPIFADIKVRQALALAIDFNWMNKALFYGQYTRINSYFSNTKYAYNKNNNNDNNYIEQQFNLRQRLLKAQELLKQAGWTYKEGWLRNAKGEIFSFEILDSNGSLNRVISAYIRNLNKLGIAVSSKTVDASIYQKRLENFDFDMTTKKYGDSNYPGNEVMQRFSSTSADTTGSENIMGIKDIKIDALLAEITQAKNDSELLVAAKQLDKALIDGYYIIPHWYSDSHRVAYANHLKYPQMQTLPLYYDANSWIMGAWWSNK
jgi:microcin C transport system substrate-binding protein